MSVLMRKPDLVKRYCCVLQILDSSVDVFNDDQMVKHRNSGQRYLWLKW